MSPVQIVVAGASGFVGANLITRLLEEFPDASITALSRANQKSTNARLTWKACDLFSEASIGAALPAQIDLVYYLVHSMGPTAQLDQGSFADYDLIMADSFARVCRAKDCKQLIYLGGLVPENGPGNLELSLHLRSRLEVEEVFEDHGVPTTVFRAGLILGEGGSSFQILTKLVKRLRVLVCPAWTQTMTSPSDLTSTVSALVAAAKSEEHLHRTYDLAGCRPLTYLDMMKQTAQALGLRRYFLTVPLFTPTLSRLWVTLVTGTSKNLVYPLIESLQHEMVARESHTFSNDWRSCSYQDLMAKVQMRTTSRTFRFRSRFSRRTVRSVQRVEVLNQSAQTVAEAYFNWLPRVTLGLISVRKKGAFRQLRLLNRVTLIELRESASLSGPDRVTYYIQSGTLVSKCPDARLEFRLVLGGKFVLIAIHDYAPALPWFVYKYTQAQLHLFVMRAFGRFIKKPA